MFRTRDFILVLTTVAFLVLAIGATVFTQWQTAAEQKTQLQPAVIQDGEYSAVTFNSHEFSRAEKLQEMRKKIAASSQLSITAPNPVEMTQEATTSTSTAASQELVSGLQLCPGYTASNVNWSPVGAQIEEAEGARLVYKTREESPVVIQNTGATTSPAIMPPQRVVLAQLPVRTVPAVNPVCIPFDVIGIANDGSLIRNNEAGVYGIFNSSTLVGYALDGFPIYGSAAEVGDTCGGIMAAEGYRYQISLQRETIINCYAATPIRL
jgi:hypothetical protein